jgi:hypothetical protein
MFLLCRLDGSGFESQQSRKNFLLLKTSKPTFGPTRRGVLWVPGYVPAVKVAGTWCWSFMSTAPKLGMSGATSRLPQYAFIAWTGTTLFLNNMLPACWVQKYPACGRSMFLTIVGNHVPDCTMTAVFIAKTLDAFVFCTGFPSLLQRLS